MIEQQLTHTLLETFREKHEQATTPEQRRYIAAIMGMWAESAGHEFQLPTPSSPFDPDSHCHEWFLNGTRVSRDAREIQNLVT